MIAPAKPIYTTRQKKRTPKNLTPGIMVKGTDDRWHCYLNAALPTNTPIDDTFCRNCHHGYAELAHAEQCDCQECRLESWMARAQEIQDECGVTLIPKTADQASMRAVYGYRDRNIHQFGHS